MRFFIIGIISIFINNCTSIQKETKYLDDWKLLSLLEINKDTTEDIKRKLGAPNEIYTEQLEPNEEQWNYFRSNIPKIHIFFVNGILQAVSTDIWNKESLADLSYLLKEFSGKWTVIKEEPVSHHYMPFHCYLVDESNGKKIEIHAYQKVVEAIWRWNPKMPLKKGENTKKIPDVDENRCAWLNELIRK